jgi:hypothetical protein
MSVGGTIKKLIAKHGMSQCMKAWKADRNRYHIF